MRTLSPATQLIACSAAGDRKNAERLKTQSPNLISALGESDKQMVTELAALGKTEAVLLMIDMGFDINQRGNWGGTVIQQAAYHGYCELVDRLIARKADLEIQNDYQGTTLGAAVFASESMQIAESDTRYIAIAESLLEADAKLLPHLLTMGNETMSDFLKTYSSGN